MLYAADYFKYADDPNFPDMGNRPTSVDTSLAYPLHEDYMYGQGGSTLIERPIWHGDEESAGHTLANDFYKTHIDDRIWLRQLEIDAGFVVEDVEYDMEIWNAKDSAVQCTSVSYDPSATGLSQDHPVVPFTVNPNYITSWTLTVLRDGDPKQDTEITFTIDSGDYLTTVEATRVVNLPFEPNWIKSVRFQMSYDTSMLQTERWHEQRRPLTDRPIRQTTFSVDETSNLAQKFFNTIQRGKDKIMGVPIYLEVFKVLSATAGLSVLNTDGDVDDRWHLNNFCNFIKLVDIVTYDVELKEIDTVGTSSITLVNPLVNTFDVDRTFVYPIFLGVVQAVRWTNFNYNVHGANVVFEEI